MKQQINYCCLLLGFLLIPLAGFAQEETSGIDFYVDQSVINADDPDEKEIINLWQNYIESNQYKVRDSVYWSYDKMVIPDYFMWPLNTATLPYGSSTGPRTISIWYSLIFAKSSSIFWV